MDPILCDVGDTRVRGRDDGLACAHGFQIDDAERFVPAHKSKEIGPGHLAEDIEVWQAAEKEHPVSQPVPIDDLFDRRSIPAISRNPQYRLGVPVRNSREGLDEDGDALAL